MCKYAISHDGCVQRIHVTHIKSTNLHTKKQNTLKIVAQEKHNVKYASKKHAD